MNQAITVRPARPSDLQEIIHLAAHVSDWTYGRISPRLHEALAADLAGVVGGEEHWRDSVVALLAGKIVGVVLVGGDRLEDLWIDPSCHRQGLGSWLLGIAEEKIRASGARRANLNVVLQNTNALRFYEAHGWERGECYCHDRWGFTMLRMSKNMLFGRHP